MKKLLAVTAILLLAVFSACKTDNDDPFGEEGVDLNWPTTDPDRFHWNGIQENFFEQWSWHIALSDGETDFSITMGVLNPGGEVPEARGGFLVVESSTLDKPQILLTNLRDFSASVALRDITIGGNRGTQTVVRGGLDDGTSVVFDLRFSIEKKWDDTMGYLTDIPLLPMNWHVNALAASADGTISIGGETYDIDGAAAMEDHFWGARFPEATTRILAWRFGDGDSSLAYLGGNLLLGPLELPSVIMAYQKGNDLYEFRSQDLDVLATTWRDGNGLLNIEATKGTMKIRLHILNVGEEPAPGLVLDEFGFSLGGKIHRKAVVNVELFQPDEHGGWERFDTSESTQSVFAIGVDDLYHDAD